MSFNQHIGETSNPLAKARPNDLMNEKVVAQWFKLRFNKTPEGDKSYFREWAMRMRVAYREEGKDAFPWQADNKSIRTWKKLTGRRQLRINTKDEATIKGPSKFKRGQRVHVPAPREWRAAYPQFRNARVAGEIERELSGNRYEVAVLRPDAMATQHIILNEREIRRGR